LERATQVQPDSREAHLFLGDAFAQLAGKLRGREHAVGGNWAIHPALTEYVLPQKPELTQARDRASSIRAEAFFLASCAARFRET